MKKRYKEDMYIDPRFEGMTMAEMLDAVGAKKVEWQA
jgi:hypothetical protein